MVISVCDEHGNNVHNIAYGTPVSMYKGQHRLERVTIHTPITCLWWQQLSVARAKLVARKEYRFNHPTMATSRFYQ